MEHKNLIGISLFLGATFGVTLLTCLSYRIRDAVFWLMVTLAPLTEYIDVNFDSKEWYRGTTCGYEVSIVDVLSVGLLLSSFIRPREGEKRWFWPASLGFMILFFLYAAFCVGMADPKIFGLFELSKMVRGLVMFVATALYLRSERELRLFLFALGVAVCYQSLMAVQQRYVFHVNRVYGTLDDSNSVSMFLCTTAPVFVAVMTARLPKYFKALAAAAVALAFVGVILTISRAGLIDIMIMLFATAVATISYRITLRKVLICLLVVAGIGGALGKAWKTVGARFAGDSLKNEYQKKHEQNRGYYIRIAAAIADDSWFGVGPNNWSFWVSNKYGPRQGYDFVPYSGTEHKPIQIVPPGRDIDDPQAAPAHSLPALTAGEMGIGGLVVFGILWLRWLSMGASFLWPRTPDPMRRIGVGIFFGMCGTLFQSMTEWVFHQTPIFYMFHIMAGVLASLYYLRKCERKARKRERKARWLEEERIFNQGPPPRDMDDPFVVSDFSFQG